MCRPVQRCRCGRGRTVTRSRLGAGGSGGGGGGAAGVEKAASGGCWVSRPWRADRVFVGWDLESGRLVVNCAAGLRRIEPRGGDEPGRRGRISRRGCRGEELGGPRGGASGEGDGDEKRWRERLAGNGDSAMDPLQVREI